MFMADHPVTKKYFTPLIYLNETCFADTKHRKVLAACWLTNSWIWPGSQFSSLQRVSGPDQRSNQPAERDHARRVCGR